MAIAETLTIAGSFGTYLLVDLSAFQGNSRTLALESESSHP